MYQRQITKENSVFIILILIGFFFVIGKFSTPVNLIKSFIYYISYPNLNAANDIFYCVDNFANNIKSIVCMRQENILYKRKNQELIDKLRNYDAISQKYEELSKLLKLKKINNTVSVFARVLVRESDEWYRWLIIDKGFNDGLYNELPVVMFNKNKDNLCAVGRIIETYKNSAKVILITNSVCMLPVEIKDKNINCLAEGFDSNLLKITYIPAEADVKKGDELIVSGLSSIFHKGMPVGVIKSITNAISRDFKTATAKVFFESNIIYNAVILVPKE
ncbi:MAG: rod shape-determining protein MreC [Endomicrobium sp.]|jgi:rod shape-determining protein MreC|nr:rod shape-determining protein MreC [Endomicrobium sp.]